MKTLIWGGLAVATLSIAADLPAHGGVYRGPGDTVPSPPSGGRGSTPGPDGPETPVPGQPSFPDTGGPSTGGGGPPTGGGGRRGQPRGSSPTTGGGMEVGDDLTRWEFWWEFNKDPFIQLKRAIHANVATTGGDEYFMGFGKVAESKNSLRPSESQIVDEILPRLKEALDATDQRDITSACMVAMGKIGRDHRDFGILDMFRTRLTSRDLEVRQTAALSMGISQMTESIDDLIAIAMDTKRGRELCARTEIDDPTRSFAAYGCGLVAWATSDAELKGKVFEQLSRIVADRSISDRNIRVAAIQAIGLLRPDPNDARGRELLRRCYESLVDQYWRREVGPGEQLIQAHVPTAMSKLLLACPDADLRKDLQDDLLRTLAGKSRIQRSKQQIHQSCALALGQLATPSDAHVSKALLDYYKKGKDQQTRYFCLMALGQIGGDQNRDALLEVLQKGGKAIVKPWAAIALGVLCFDRLEAGGPVDPLVGRAMHARLREVKAPQAIAGLAIGLGLARYQDSADEIRALLEKHQNKDDVAGYLCIALALMDDRRAIPAIRQLVETSDRRPARLTQASVALGKLGDIRVAELLTEKLTEDSTILARMSAIASALGLIGDSRSVKPLGDMLLDDSLSDLTRAFAAVALGGVADKEDLPWNSKIGQNINYRAAVETLTNQQSGILDIL
ncbi:MAG: HEAT repeat domain-containing protein [Planctomycetes bacterium]|nr:HEAT repeat domain-containing protein [Planctomycetota bacterium]